MWQKVSFFQGIQLVWIQSFPALRQVALPKLKSPVCLTILPIIRGRRYGSMSFPRALVQSETQTAFSRIWIWLVRSTSYNYKGLPQVLHNFYTSFHKTAQIEPHNKILLSSIVLNISYKIKQFPAIIMWR